MNILEPYHQIYAYDTGNNLICLSHQAKSSTWQQNISIHLNDNQGTETKLPTNDFDASGNLLTLNNIATLDWYYNNTLNKLNKLTKDDKTTEYYVYDHQGNRVRTALESNQQIQSQKDYLPSLDISINRNQKTNTLHISAHILSETTKDTQQTRYQLSSHLQSNTLELNDKAKVISYEHFYPYGGTALIAGKDQTQVQQKRYRYTGKERDDSSGLSYYGARYLAPWMARWISPDSAGAVDGLNLYVYAGNNPLKYIDPTGHVITIPTISWDSFTSISNAHMKTHELNFWVGEEHFKLKGRELLFALDRSITHKGNIAFELCDALAGERPIPWEQEKLRKEYSHYRNQGTAHEQSIALATSRESLYELTRNRNGYYIGRNKWGNIASEKEMLRAEGMRGDSHFLVGGSHVLSHGLTPLGKKQLYDKNSMPIYWHFAPDSSIALVPREVFNFIKTHSWATVRDSMEKSEYGMWVLGEDGSVGNATLVLGQKHVMRGIFGKIAKKIPQDLNNLRAPSLYFAPLMAKSSAQKTFEFHEGF